MNFDTANKQMLILKKVLLAGDHCQLPPTIHSVQAAEEGLADTLFAKLIRKLGDKAARLLTVQYRMNTRIMTWASKEFYEGKLEAHDTVAKHLLYGIWGLFVFTRFPHF